MFIATSSSALSPPRNQSPTPCFCSSRQTRLPWTLAAYWSGAPSAAFTSGFCPSVPVVQEPNTSARPVAVLTTLALPTRWKPMAAAVSLTIPCASWQELPKYWLQLLDLLLQGLDRRHAGLAHRRHRHLEGVAGGIGGSRLHQRHELVGADEREAAGEEVDAAAPGLERGRHQAHQPLVHDRHPAIDPATGQHTAPLRAEGGRPGEVGQCGELLVHQLLHVGTSSRNRQQGQGQQEGGNREAAVTEAAAGKGGSWQGS